MLETKPFTVGASGGGAQSSTTVALSKAYSNVNYALQFSGRYDVAVYINGISGNNVTIACTTYYGSAYKSVSGDVVVYKIE